MKMIHYNICRTINTGSACIPQLQEKLFPVMLGYNENNLAIAQAEAHNGEYTIEEVADSTTMPTTEERLSALEGAVLEILGVTVDG